MREVARGDKYTISPGCRGSMAKSRPATAARGLPWRAEMQPNCPSNQERLCLSSWNRYSTRTGKARKNRTRRESFLARKNDRNCQPREIANLSPRAEICNLTWLESADSVLAKQVPVQSSKVHVRSQNLATFVDLIGQCHGYRHVTYDKLKHYLIMRKSGRSQSTNQKDTCSPQRIDLCFAICRFSGSVYPFQHLTHNIRFYFQ